MTLATYNLCAAVYLVILQGIDLHTTSEVLKRKLGIEGNPYLAGQLNTDEQHSEKFWRLAAYKLAASALCIAIGAVGWFVAGQAAYAATGLTLLAVWYTYVALNNLKLYWGD